MKFISTRGKSGRVSSAEAIIKGLADDGGLFVPEYFPKAFEKLKEKISISYEELAFEIIKEFCECFNIPYRTVTEWERGTRNAPDYVLRLLAYYIRMENMLKEKEEGYVEE